jgi:6-pyruvoyltetrahydropterin/6-carboxytetrahydropterin synthase
MLTVTRKLEFDAGHRIPNHVSQCRNLHGHRYVLELTLIGNVIDQEAHSSQGMLMDFSDIKRIAKQYVVDLWDHAFLVYEGDEKVVDFLKGMSDHKTVILPVIPTAENLVSCIFNILAPHYESVFGNQLSLAKVRLYETPNCWADYGPLVEV